MSNYPFYLVDHDRDGSIEDRTLLAKRPFMEIDQSFAGDAKRFVPGEQLETSINTAIAVGEPLLITGEPGTGKTQTAYYVAYKLGIEPVVHFQVKSDSTAQDLLYHFDTVRYFHDANLPGSGSLDKSDYIERRALWTAFETAKKTGYPQILLIDEIDKAPRDFPNDLLLELDKMQFTIKETNTDVVADIQHRPIVFITSNSERRLPEPFLRRCVYHHIRFDRSIVEQAVAARRDEFPTLDDNLIDLSLRRFFALRDRSLRKLPATGEYLVWLNVLALAIQTEPENLIRALEDTDLSQLPYIGVLLKDHQDIQELKTSRGM